MPVVVCGSTCLPQLLQYSGVWCGVWLPSGTRRGREMSRKDTELSLKTIMMATVVTEVLRSYSYKEYHNNTYIHIVLYIRYIVLVATIALF